jgi:glutathione S-transferase
MVLKLYGAAPSCFSHLVILVLKETNTPYEFHEIFDKATIKSESYLEKHPFGQIPYIVCLPPLMHVHGLTIPNNLG